MRSTLTCHHSTCLLFIIHHSAFIIFRKAHDALSQSFYSRRTTFAVFACAALLAATLLPLTNASCSRTQQPRPDEPQAFERLRALTRGGQLPAESIVAEIAAQHAGSRAGALARLLQARLRLEAKDFAGAASLLDAKDFARHTAVGDHALWMRAEALEQLGRRVEARAAFEQLVRDFPDALRAREATLRAARLALKDGQPAAVPTFLKKLARRRRRRSAPAHGQSLRAERRPAARARRLPPPLLLRAVFGDERRRSGRRLRSARLFDRARQRRRGDHARRRTRRAPSATPKPPTPTPTPSRASPKPRRPRRASAPESPHTTRAAPTPPASSPPSPPAPTRAPEALHTLAQHHARLRQWDNVRTTLDEMRRTFPQSEWTMRALVAAGQAARDAKNRRTRSTSSASPRKSFPGAAEVAGAQFEVAWAAHEAKNFAESSRLLTEHLANYADKNTDNRGRAGYWAARDTERAGPPRRSARALRRRCSRATTPTGTATSRANGSKC